MPSNRVFECLDCGNTWSVDPCSAGGKHGPDIACPKCGSMKKAKLVNGQQHICGGQYGQQSHHRGGCCGGRRP